MLNNKDIRDYTTDGYKQPVANTKQVGGQHYQSPIQAWDFILANQLGYLEGTAIKYITRHAAKGGKEDIQKAIHFLEKLLETYDKY